MSEPLFETSLMGSKVKVFNTHIAYKETLRGEVSIPLDQIASVELARFLGQITIETTGGKKIKIPVNMKDKENLRDAIYSAKSK